MTKEDYKEIADMINIILFRYEGEIYVGKRVLDISVGRINGAFVRLYKVKESIDGLYSDLYEGDNLLTALDVLIQGE